MDSPPDLVKKGTFVIATPPDLVPDPVTAIGLPPASFEFSGKVAPVAAIAIVPVPSDEIVEPPKLTVELERNISLHLLEALPNSLVPSASGNICSSTAD